MADYTVQVGSNTITATVNIGSTVQTFLDLTDTPSSYASQALKGVRVNAAETALEFYDTVTDTDEKTKVSANDTTAGYLNGKLVAGTNITFQENNDGGNETLTISSAADSVTSVFGRTGDVSAASNDYTWSQIDKTVSDIADITTKSHTSLSDIGTNTHAQIDTHISASSAHGVSGDVVGTSDSQTLTNKTITTPTLTLKQGLTPAPTAEGDIQWDTDNDQIKIGDGVGTKTFSSDADLSITASQVSDFDTEVSNNTDVAANTSARHDAVTVADSSEIDFTLTGQQITASLIAGSIDETKLDTSTNASLDLADSSLQPGDIGVTVQGYDADTAKYDDVTANFTGTLQNGGSNVLVDTDIGSTVQEELSGATITSATVATDDKVLIQDTNDSNNLKYVTAQSIADLGGGGGVSIFESTVGATGADYTTLGAAIAAGKTRVLVIDDTTETGDITMPSNLYVRGIGKYAVTIAMGSNKFDQSTNDDFTFKDLSISFANTSGTSYDLFSVAGTNLNVENVYFNNSSTTRVNSRVIDSSNGKLFVKNCSIDLPNTSGCGIYINTTTGGEYAIVDGLDLNGSGTSCYEGLITFNNAQVSNLNLYGTFKTNSNAININNSTVNNIICDTTNEPVQLEFDVGSTVTNITSDSFRACVIYVNTDSSASNIVTLDSASHIYISGENASVSNVSTEGDINVFSGGGFCRIINSNFAGGVTIAPDNCSIIGCKVGADAGGGSNTITVSAGADNTTIVGCHTDAAISDSGTGTTTAANVVY